MASSTEELDLLERVFLRIGSAETDQQLEAAISKFLIPVLLKLSSPNEGVRKKVMELLVHINKRVKRRPTVQLPVEALLQQYSDPKASSFLINFSILYIKLGFPRLPSAKQEELAPVLLLASEGKPKIHQDSLLLLLMSVIGSIKVPPEPEKRKQLFKLDEKPDLSKHLSSFMLDVLLLPYAYISPSDENTSAPGQSNPAPQAPPGMSEYGVKRVNSGDTPMTPERLEQTKLGIVKFLGSGVLSNDEIICHLIIAAADTRFTVANLADTELKRIANSVDWSNIGTATKLFHIYLGSPEIPADKRNPIPPANRITPANTRIRLKILPYLSRLEKDAILFPGSIQVIFNSLYDTNTNPKLKLQALNFALAIVRRSDIQALNKMGGMLYTGLLKLVWNAEESEQLRVVGYTIIGQIVKRLPHIINKNLIELQVFFENLSCDQADIRTAVRDSLLTMVDAFKMFMKDEKDEKMEVDNEPSKDDKNSLPNRELIMMALLSSQIEAPEPMARFVAVKYTAAVFHSNHVQSRYLLLLSTGDTNSDVSSVAVKSLYCSFESEDEEERKKVLFPDFREMSQCIYEKAMSRMKNTNQKFTVQNHVLPFNETTFYEILTYLRLCLAKSSGIEVSSKELIMHPCDQSHLIGKYVSEVHQSDPDVFNNYLSLIEKFIPVSSSLIPISCLVEVVGACPQFFAARYAEKIQWITNFLNHTKEEIREQAAILLSIVCAATMDESKLNGTLKELMNNLKSKSIETQHGTILSLGHIIERKVTENGSDATNKEFLEEIVKELAKHLEDSHVLLMLSSCAALGLIGKSIPLPLPDDSEKELSKRGLIKKLIEIVKDGKRGMKMKEKAVQACGMMCLGEKFPFAKDVIVQFLELSKQTKDIDVHFSISESIILCIEGISSPQKRNSWKVEKSQYVPPPVPEDNLNLLDWLLTELLELAKRPHPNVRQSVCVYLLSIVKRLSTRTKIKDNLGVIQNVFMEFLSENNELVQDMASKGLALVYEFTTEENKKELVSLLLDQLLSGKRAVQQVTSDTKLFEEGQLGASPIGGNLSTYKELCSLASDLNQPDLIYKFMHLANHNAIWNSKKGAAFGFQTIASQANDQLNEYLPKIIPRLYRYQFDPTPRIQQSMANIWHSIVKDPQKAVDKYYNEILDDLLVNLTSNQWRVRYSCCLALTDFFRGNRSVLDAKHKLSELWKSLFRVMDDVHEGTRIAAQNTSKGLAKLCVKVCDTEAGKVNSEMLNVVLEVFLSGITNPVAEVRSLSLQTISQLVNSAGATLKPNLPSLIPCLLEAAGELESVGLSYLSAQYSAQTQTQDMIDSVRASAAKSHYTTQTVTKCVQYVELETLDSLVPKVAEIMKSVNLGSRVACAHLIILLAHHLGRSMEQYTGKLLSALVNGLLDRNATVRKTYASTIGQIVHTAKSSSMERLVTKLSNWYFEKEDISTRTAIGLTLQAIAQYNGELLKEQFPVVIPLIFFAMHAQKVEGEDNSHVEMWEEIWNEVTPGSEAGIKQNISEINQILETALTSPSWTMKAQGGRCVSTVAVKIGDSLDSTHRDKLIEMVLKALYGKTFPGKESLLKGLSKLATHCSDGLKQSPQKCQEIVDVLLRESNKSELGYKKHGLEALGIALEAFDNIDCFQQVYDIVKDLLKKLDEEAEDGEISEELTKIRNEKFKTIEVIYETLGKSWPKNKTTQLKYEDVLLNECYGALERSPRDIQVAVLTALRSYLEKLHYFNEDYAATPEENKNVSEILEKTIRALQFSLGLAKHTRLRKEALNIIFTLGNKLNSSGRTEELKKFTDSLRNRLQELEKDSSPEIRTRLMDLKEMFKN